MKWIEYSYFPIVHTTIFLTCEQHPRPVTHDRKITVLYPFHFQYVTWTPKCQGRPIFLVLIKLQMDNNMNVVNSEHTFTWVLSQMFSVPNGSNFVPTWNAICNRDTTETQKRFSNEDSCELDRAGNVLAGQWVRVWGMVLLVYYRKPLSFLNDKNCVISVRNQDTDHWCPFY